MRFLNVPDILIHTLILNKAITNRKKKRWKQIKFILYANNYLELKLYVLDLELGLSNNTYVICLKALICWNTDSNMKIWIWLLLRFKYLMEM